jgi:hypothetical protein
VDVPGRRIARRSPAFGNTWAETNTAWLDGRYAYILAISLST